MEEEVVSGDLAEANQVANQHKEAMELWMLFMKKSVQHQLPVEKFERLVEVHYGKHPLPPRLIAELILRPTPQHDYQLPVPVPIYIQKLLELGFIDIPSLLLALYKYSSSHNLTAAKSAKRWKHNWLQEEFLFYRMSKMVSQGKGIKDVWQGALIAVMVTRWMTLFTAASAAFQADILGQLQVDSAKPDMEAANAAFVMLLLNVCESDVVARGLAGARMKGGCFTSLPPPSSFVIHVG
jgi:mediator of RNA polymerase II transcription subunit 5